jgi:hypothetical protein
VALGDGELGGGGLGDGAAPGGEVGVPPGDGVALGVAAGGLVCEVLVPDSRVDPFTPSPMTPLAEAAPVLAISWPLGPMKTTEPSMATT